MRRFRSMSGQSRPRFPVRPAAMAAFAMLSFAAMARQPAHADNKWYPGSLCQRMDSTSDVYATDYNRIHNSSSQYARSVNCPLVRDNTGNTNGSSGEAWVYVYNDSSIWTLSCTFYSSSGSIGSSVFSNTTSTSKAGNIKFIIPVTASASNGPYGLKCTLPPRSDVISYQMPEYGPTD